MAWMPQKPGPARPTPVDWVFRVFIAMIVVIIALASTIRDVKVSIKWRGQPDVYHYHHYADGRVEKTSGP